MSWMLVMMESVYVMTGKNLPGHDAFWGKLFAITWILGLGFALAAGIINVMLETTYALGGLDEQKNRRAFRNDR